MPKRKAKKVSPKNSKKEKMLVIANGNTTPSSRKYHLTNKSIDIYTWAEIRKYSPRLLDYSIIVLDPNLGIVQKELNGAVLSTISKIKTLSSRKQVVIILGFQSTSMQNKDVSFSNISRLINKNIQSQPCDFPAQDVQTSKNLANVEVFQDVLKMGVLFDNCFKPNNRNNYLSIFDVKSTQTSVGGYFNELKTFFVYLPFFSIFNAIDKSLPQFHGQRKDFEKDPDLQRLEGEAIDFIFIDDRDSKELYQALDALYGIGVYFLNKHTTASLSEKQGFPSHKSLIRFKSRYNKEKSIIIVGDKTVPIPPDTKESAFCEHMFKKKVDVFVSWDILCKKITSNKGETGADHHLVYDAVRRVNKRLDGKLKTKQKLFSWEHLKVKRNF